MMMRRPFLLLLAVVSLVGPRASGSDRGLDLYFVDVMGGAATLIVTPERESILIDSGWPGFDDRDPKRIVAVLKGEAGLDRIDHLVTTHWHVDHFGGVEGLTRLTTIGRFWDRGLPDPAAPDGDVARFPDGPKPDNPLGIAYRKAAEGKRQELKAGDVLPLKSVALRVLTSGGEVIGGPAGPAGRECEAHPLVDRFDRSDNARSLGFKLTYGRFDFLDCGDLTWDVEKALVCPTDRIGPIDVYQVTHHGMDISNHPALVRTIAPTVTIMNNGPRKGGAPATVKLLKSIPSIKAAYQLHRNVATTDEDNTDPSLIANPSPEGGRFIHVAVAPGGGSYTVRIGKEGGRTFESR